MVWRPGGDNGPVSTPHFTKTTPTYAVKKGYCLYHFVYQSSPQYLFWGYKKNNFKWKKKCSSFAVCFFFNFHYSFLFYIIMSCDSIFFKQICFCLFTCLKHCICVVYEPTCRFYSHQVAKTSSKPFILKRERERPGDVIQVFSESNRFVSVSRTHLLKEDVCRLSVITHRPTHFSVIVWNRRKRKNPGSSSPRGKSPRVPVGTLRVSWWSSSALCSGSFGLETLEAGERSSRRRKLRSWCPAVRSRYLCSWSAQFLPSPVSEWFIVLHINMFHQIIYYSIRDEALLCGVIAATNSTSSFSRLTVELWFSLVDVLKVQSSMNQSESVSFMVLLVSAKRGRKEQKT